MDENVSTFVSTINGWDSTALIFAALSVISLVILITYLMKSDKRIAALIKSPYTLLLLATVVLTACIALYTWKSTQELHKVIITSNSIITPFGSCDFSNIKNAKIITLLPKRENLDNQTDNVTFLLIEEYTGKAHPLSEENYDIDAILKELQKHLADKVH